MSKQCPYCGASLPPAGNKERGGERLTCPKCGNHFTATREVTQILATPEEPDVAVGGGDDNVANAARLYREAGADLTRKNFKLAVHRLTAAAELDPRRLDILLALGGACSHANMVYEALAAYRKALELSPDDETALMRSAMLCAQQKSYDEAEERLNRLVELAPDHPQAGLLREILRQERNATRTKSATRRAAPPVPPVGARLTAVIDRLGPADRWGALAWVIPPPLFAVALTYGVDDTPWRSGIVAAMFLYVVFLAVVLHELAHGLTAHLLGDDTPLEAERLSLNPFVHLSPIGSVIVPATVWSITGLMFGWARPIPFEPLDLRRHPRDLALVAVSGPAASFALSFVCLILYLIAASFYNDLHPGAAPTLSAVMGRPATLAQIGGGFWRAALYLPAMGIVVNLLVAAFNLIPIPPLDGGWLLRSVSPAWLAVRLDQFGWLALGIIPLAIWFGQMELLFFPARLALSIYEALAGAILS